MALPSSAAWALWGARVDASSTAGICRLATRGRGNRYRPRGLGSRDFNIASIPRPIVSAMNKHACVAAALPVVPPHGHDLAPKPNKLFQIWHRDFVQIDSVETAVYVRVRSVT